MAGKSITDGKRGLKRLVRVFGVIVLVILVVLVSGHWLFQNLIRYRVERRLARFSEGPVRIETVKAGLSGQIYLEGIRFCDRAKRPWLFVEKAEVALTQWPSLKPVVKEVEVDGLNLQILSDEEEFDLPLVFPSRSEAGSGRKPSLDKVTVEKAAISIIDAQDLKTAYDNLKLSAVRENGIYQFVLDMEGIESSEIFRAEGKIDSQSRNFDVSLQVKHHLTKAEMALPFVLLKKIKDVSAEGAITADLDFTGSLDALSGLQSNGYIELDQGILYFKDEKLAQDIVARANFEGQSLQCDEFSAASCSGLVNGSAYMKAEPNQPMEYGGGLLARELSLVELSAVVGGPGKKASKGSVSFNYSFSAKKGDVQSHDGEGQIFLDDADLTIFPVITHIFKTIGLATLEPLKISDAECMFSMTGPYMKIQSAHISNRFGATEAEPGGTINLQTGQLDMYVVGVPLRQLDVLARRIPFADIFLNLRNRLVRLRINGHWSSPPAKLITKTPIRDIKEGTVGFLRDVLRNGGQFGQEILKGLKVLVPAPKNNSN